MSEVMIFLVYYLQPPNPELQIYFPHLSARQSQATRISKAQADAWFCRYVDFTDESSEDQNGNHVIDGELVIQNLRTPKLTKPVRVVESFAFSNIIFR